MKASFEIPAVIGVMDYHDIDDIHDIFIDLNIKDVKVEEKSVDGAYYAIVYQKGHRPLHKKMIEMINKYEDESEQ